MSAPGTRRPVDAGFTMIELLTVITMVGIIMAIAISGWVRWTNASAQSGATEKLEGVMRSAQQRAVTESTSVCVLFNVGADTYTTYIGACSASTKVLLSGPFGLDSKSVHLSSAVFTGSSGTSAGVTFTSRGTATPGKLKLRRDDAATVTTVTVEGLTGRVVIA